MSDPELYYAAAATLSSVISGTTSIHCKKNMRNSAIKKIIIIIKKVAHRYNLLSRKSTPRLTSQTIGTLRSNDADDNENVQKIIGLIGKTTTSHVQHTFLYISFPFLHDYDVKMPHFAFYGGRKQATTKFFFSF